MERRTDLTVVDLDQAGVEIQQRWFVWTAAGLTVRPVTWTDHDAPRPAPLVGRADVATPRSMGIQVSRPNARADIVLYRDGWTEVAVRRPDADAAVQETGQVASVGAFGALLDRVIELITWSGVPSDPQGSAPGVPSRPERAAHWVLGHDGLRLPLDS